MEQEITKQFSIKDIQLYTNDEDKDFAHVEIWALSEGSNTHKNPVPIDVLKRDAHTLIGKPIIGKYSRWEKDTTTHTLDQSILGWIPTNQSVRFIEKDGKTFMVLNGLLSKLYAKEVVDMFRNNNFRNVSCEFTCDEEDENEFGEKPLSKLNFHAVTILGLKYNPSCKGCEMKVKQFAKFEEDGSELKKFADKRKKEMDKKSYKINKTDLKESEWGAVDKTILRNKIMDAKNRDSLVNSVYALVESGWKDAPSKHLKYPLMQLIEDTFYYNRHALSSALGYAKQENETSVVNKVESLYRKFSLEDEDKEDFKIMEEEKKDNKTVGKDDKITEKNASPESKAKEMSNDANIDTVATLAFLEKETEGYRDMITKMYAKDKETIMCNYLELAKERDTLKKYKESREESDKESEVNKVMSAVKDDIETKDFDALHKEGMSLTFADMKVFSDKVKAFAYVESKKVSKERKKKENIKTYGILEQGNHNETKKITATEIFEKYSNL